MTLTLDHTARLLDQPAPAVPGQLAIPTGPRIGSFCTGYGGLDMAVQAVFGGTLAWVSDVDRGASAILAHHHPDVPNHGDIKTANWADIEPVDIACGGYPCQPFSTAGLRKGTADARHLWPHIERALGVLRPRIAVFENVANHLRVGFTDVLGGLADLGFNAEWCIVRADEVGAPHQRKRLWLLAVAADAPDLGHEWDGAARGRRRGSSDGGRTAADAAGIGRGEGRAESARQQGRLGAAGRGRSPAADADRGRLEGRPAVHGEEPTLPAAYVDGQRPDWGNLGPAVSRWEAVTGRPAPRATDVRGRLSPPFVEWMMGLPVGHVTAVPGLSRTQQLKALGNGVVPRQAEAAIRLLVDRAAR